MYFLCSDLTFVWWGSGCTVWRRDIVSPFLFGCKVNIQLYFFERQQESHRQLSFADTHNAQIAYPITAPSIAAGSSHHALIIGITPYVAFVSFC